MQSFKIALASAEVIFSGFVGETNSSIQTRISRAGIHNNSFLAIPTPKVDSASAIVRYAGFVREAHAAVEARPFRARVHDDAICASASGPTLMTDAFGDSSLVGAFSVSTLDVVTWIKNFPLTDVPISGGARHVVPTVVASHLLQTILDKKRRYQASLWPNVRQQIGH